MGPLPKMEKLKKQRILLGIEQELGEELACRLLYGMVQKEIRAPMLSKVLNKSIEESVLILRNLFSDHTIDGGGSYNFSDDIFMIFAEFLHSSYDRELRQSEEEALQEQEETHTQFQSAEGVVPARRDIASYSPFVPMRSPASRQPSMTNVDASFTRVDAGGFGGGNPMIGNVVLNSVREEGPAAGAEYTPQAMPFVPPSTSPSFEEENVLDFVNNGLGPRGRNAQNSGTPFPSVPLEPE